MAFLMAVAGIIAWFVATLGVYIVTGEFIGVLGTMLNISPSIGMALTTFLVGALAIIGTLFVVSHVIHARRRTRGA